MADNLPTKDARGPAVRERPTPAPRPPAPTVDATAALASAHDGATAPQPATAALASAHDGATAPQPATGGHRRVGSNGQPLADEAFPADPRVPGEAGARKKPPPPPPVVVKLPPQQGPPPAIKASDLKLSSAEIIAVMNDVKCGNLTISEALASVNLAGARPPLLGGNAAPGEWPASVPAPSPPSVRDSSVEGDTVPSSAAEEPLSAAPELAAAASQPAASELAAAKGMSASPEVAAAKCLSASPELAPAEAARGSDAPDTLAAEAGGEGASHPPGSGPAAQAPAGFLASAPGMHGRELKASDLRMPDETRIAVMNNVRDGSMTIDEALSFIASTEALLAQPLPARTLAADGAVVGDGAGDHPTDATVTHISLSPMVPTPPAEPPFVPTKRVVLHANSHRDRSSVVMVPETLEELLLLAAQVLDMPCSVVYSHLGATIDDIELIRDDDQLYLSDGESFRWNRLGSSGSINRLSGGSQQRLTPRPSQEGGAVQAEEPGPTAEWVTLNVGGTVFSTTRDTLCRDADSMLAAMFSGDTEWTHARDASGAILVDRSPAYFAPILHFLRTNALVVDPGVSLEGVLAEAHFFGLWGVIDELEPRVRRRKRQEAADPPLTRQDFARILLSTASTSTLRCQGLNFEGADLSKLDLGHINFKYANLSRCNLSQCNLQHCNFIGANMRHAKLDGSDLMGCEMSRAVLDRASIRNCNFHDPSQVSKTTLEGVSVKNADLEDSNFTLVNMRAASLKGTSMLNCNLRCANFAGTDLADCNLTGCNLQGANLRGANTIGATFHRIPTAVHMSQSVVGHHQTSA